MMGSEEGLSTKHSDNRIVMPSSDDAKFEIKTRRRPKGKDMDYRQFSAFLCSYSYCMNIKTADFLTFLRH